jgi:hypothetical protein
MNDNERQRIGELASSGLLRKCPDGPVLDRFEPLLVAEALEQQALRAKLMFDHPKVDLRMDADDALLLAAFLRQQRSH